MRNILQRAWLPIAGSISSIGVKGISASATSEPVTRVVEVSHQPDLMFYFLVGVAGAIGGLVVKIAWSAMKRCFPKLLENIDN